MTTLDAIYSLMLKESSSSKGRRIYKLMEIQTKAAELLARLEKQKSTLQLALMATSRYITRIEPCFASILALT